MQVTPMRLSAARASCRKPTAWPVIHRALLLLVQGLQAALQVAEPLLQARVLQLVLLQLLLQRCSLLLHAPLLLPRLLCLPLPRRPLLLHHGAAFTRALRLRRERWQAMSDVGVVSVSVCAQQRLCGRCHCQRVLLCVVAQKCCLGHSFPGSGATLSATCVLITRFKQC